MGRKLFKKTLSIILSIVMLTSGTSVFAQDTKTKVIVPKYNRSTLETADYALLAIGNDMPVELNSAIATVNGNVYSSGDFKYAGSQLMLNGECNVAGKIIKKSSYADIQKSLDNIVKLRVKDYVGEIEALVPKDHAYVKGDMSYSGGKTTIEKDIIVSGTITATSPIINISSYVIANNDIKINTSTMNTNKDKPLILVSKNGNIDINASYADINGIIYAPNGTVRIVSSSFNLNGKIIAKNIIFECSSVTIKDNKDYFNKYIAMMPRLSLVDDSNNKMKFSLSQGKEEYDYVLNAQFCEMASESICSIKSNETVETPKGELCGLYRYFVTTQVASDQIIKSNVINYMYTENFSGEIGEDYDGDYLGDEQEIKLGTDPYLVDTDGDGLYDGHEVYMYESNPLLIDTDRDGLTDYQEVVILSYNPAKIDTDDNGIMDGDEDPDKDGVINIDEFKLNGNPLMDDSDFDELKDGKEKQLGTKLDDLDTDDDRLSDAREIEFGTDPLNPDTNGNGVLDGDEVYSTTITADVNDVDKRAVPTVDIKLKGEQVDSLRISKIDDDDSFLTKDIPGFIGCGYDFSVNREFESATLTYEFDKALLNQQNFLPRIYYYDEEAQLLEKLPNQTQNGNKVSVSLSHFSKYILVNEYMLDEAMKKEILAPVTGGGEPISLDIAYVIDTSGSMGGHSIQVTKEATKKFIDYMGETDRGCIVGFASSGYTVAPFGSDKIQLKQAVDRLGAGGGTYVESGLIQGLNNIENSPSANQKIMILLCDGDVYYTQSTLDRAKKLGVKIYTVNLVSRYGEVALKRIASETVGKYYYANEADKLFEEFGKIQDEVDLYKDSDEDGLSDYHEKRLRLGNGVTIKTDVNNPDSDGDGILDGDEVEVKLNNEVKSQIDMTQAKAEPNHKTVWYVTLKSDPRVRDTDFDGYDDFKEKTNGTNPLSWDVSDRDLAILSQVTYSRAIKDNDILTKLGDNETKNTDAGFYKTATIREMKDWRVLKYYRKTPYNEDLTYGGFSYTLFYKDNNLVIAFRGSVGNQDKSIKDKKGDWYRNYFVWSLRNDPDGILAQEAINPILKKYYKKGINIYITGHSRGGMLAQRAMAQVGNTNEGTKIKQLVYFNSLGVVRDDGAIWSNEIFNNLKMLKNKCIDMRIEGRGEYNGDIVCRLGFHVGEKRYYPVTDAALDNLDHAVEAPHSMCNFTAQILNGRYIDLK